MIEAKFPPFTYQDEEKEGVCFPEEGGPEPVGGDWKEWDGSDDFPFDLSPTDEVEVWFKDGEKSSSPDQAKRWTWYHDGAFDDIIAYRKVVKEEDSLPAPEGEGWKEWDGGCGVPPGVDPYEPVQVQFRDGSLSEDHLYGVAHVWNHYGVQDDIIRYRVVKKEEPPLQQPTTSQYQVGGDHYTNMTIQPWDAAKAWYGPVEYLGYHLITANAYLARHKSKGGLQDIKKARHHLDELIRYFEEDEDYPY